MRLPGSRGLFSFLVLIPSVLLSGQGSPTAASFRAPATRVSPGSGPAAAAWAEITPLAVAADAVLVDIPAGARALPLRNGPTGLSLVCFGGEEVAISCEQAYLEAGSLVEPRLQKGVRVKATLRKGRAPASGARVALIPAKLRSLREEVVVPLGRDEKVGGKMRRSLESDPAGSFITPQLAPGDYVLQLTSRDGRSFYRDIAVPRPEVLLARDPKATEAVLDLGEIVFAEGLTVRVFAGGPGGQPVKGVRVEARQEEELGHPRFFDAVTDAEGKAALVGLDPARPLPMACLAEGYEEFSQVYDVLPPVIECDMVPLSRLEGSVVDGRGEPVPGATLSIRPTRRRTTTGEDGRFVLSNLAAGRYDLVLAAPGFRVERRSLELQPGERRILPRVELQPGREIHGLVRDARTREPVSGAAVVSLQPVGAVQATSDADGEFTFESEDEEPLKLQVSATGYPEVVVEADPAQLASSGEERLVVDLKPGGRILVSVWDEEADAPCQGCSVNLAPLEDGGEWKKLVTDGRGEALSGPLAEGRYRVGLQREESLGRGVRVEGGQSKLDVEVVSGRTTPVRFGDPRTIEVRLHPPAPDGWSLVARGSSGFRSAERLGDGVFRVRKPGAGAVGLQLNAAGRPTQVHLAVLTPDDDSPQVDLTLPQGGIQGRLVKGEAPAAGRLVSLVSATGAEPFASATSADDGSFSIPFLPEGLYTVVVDGQALRSFALAHGDAEDLGLLRVRGRKGADH